MGTLGLSVSGLLIWLLVGPYLDLDDSSAHAHERLRPATDLPDLPGYRSVWANARPPQHRVRRGDRLLEVITRGARPFALHFSDPLEQVDNLMSYARAALIVRLDGDLTGDAGAQVMDAPSSTATIETVLFDRRRTKLGAGGSIPVIGYQGTRVMRVGTTRLVLRPDDARAPRQRQRYLLFVLGTSHGDLSLAYFGYGNAFEIRGRRLVNMSMPDDGAWRRSASLGRVISLISRRAEAMHPETLGDIDLSPRFLR